MRKLSSKTILSFALCWLVLGCSAWSRAQQPMVEPFLMTGKLNEGKLALEAQLVANPDDDQARFGLGVLRFMQSAEHLGQSWYKYGISDDVNQIPFFRFPAPDNPNPEQITYQDFRAVLQTMIGHLDEADRLLGEIKSTDVKLPLHLFQFHFDFDRNGMLTPEEDLNEVYEDYFEGNFAANVKNLDEVVVVFDYADAQWLRGYSHLIRATAEIILAHDEEPLWDIIAPRIFANPQFRFNFMEEEYLESRKNKDNQRFIWNDQNAILDAIAAIHNLNFKLIEPERMKRAHQHLKQTVVLSRQMWEAVKAETDNDREWIPNPNQSSVVSLTKITEEMTKTWDEFLNEVDAILDGKKLLPFWRGTNAKRGVNLHKVFYEPQDLDVILWVHGSAVVPFLEEGDVTETGTWTQFQRVFGGQFFSFAAWFN